MCTERTLTKLFTSRLLRQPCTELKVGDRFSPRIEWFIPQFDRIRDGVYDRVTFCGPGCRLEVRRMIERILATAPTEIDFR